MAGRLVRTHLLMGPAGSWREDLWLQLVVSAGESAAGPAPEPKPKLTTPLPVNTCSVDSLTLLPGVGPVLAGRIDEVRRSGTVFATAADLRIVKGIGPALSGRLAPLVIFATADSAALARPQSP